MKSDDDEELSDKPLLLPILTTLSKLKNKVLHNRAVDVTERMQSNSAKLLNYTSRLYDSTKQWGDKSSANGDKLTFRGQKVSRSLTGTDPGNDGKDDGLTFPSIISGPNSGGKSSLKPVKLAARSNVPPYTTWIFLDRNQRMAEDQSVQGRRRIYYDPIGNETLIASDSEEEEPGEEEPRHEFSRGEDFIIWTHVRDWGPSYLVFEQLSHCFRVGRQEIEARYELLLTDENKQANCEILGARIRSRFPPSPSTRQDGNDSVYLPVKETQASRISESALKACNSPKQKFDAEKAEAKDLVAAMDSFDNLFCRRCLVFDCRLHGCSQPLVHPSERQAICPADSASPCGAQCYLLSQRARGGPNLNSSMPGSSRLKDGTYSWPAEGAERSRVAKRQKIQEHVTHKVQKLASSDAVATETASVTTISEQKSSTVEYSAKISISNEDKDRCEAPNISVIESQCPKKEQPSVSSRLTSHKKLARTSRKLMKENESSDVVESHTRQRSGVSDLTKMDEGLPKRDSPGLMEKSVGEMNGTAVQYTTISEERQVEHVCKEVFMGEVVLHHEKTRFSSTKRLARSAKRTLEEFKADSQPSCEASLLKSQFTKGLLNGKNGLATGVDRIVSQDVGVDKLTLLNAVENASPVPALAEVVTTDKCQTAGDRLTEKCKVTSPKKLARNVRKPVPAIVSGNIDCPVPLPNVGIASEPTMEERSLKKAELVNGESPIKDETPKNTAARKLARSSRKAFAEKVAEAIQHQQLHSQVDASKRRGGREGSRDEKVAASVIQLPGDSVVAGAVDLIDGGQIQNAASKHNSKQDKGKSGHYAGEETKEIDSKLDQTPRRSAFISKSEGALKRVDFKDNWTAFERGLYEKGLQIFGRNSCMVAKNMLRGCKTCAEVGEYMYAQDVAAARGEAGVHQFPDSLAYVSKWDVARARARLYGKRRGSRKLKFTLKSAGQSAIRKRMVNGKDVPCRQYTPCGCLFTCGKQCPCQLSGTCCEKYCGCAKSCKNRFRGCHCAKSQCCSRQCPCFAAGRECDPDVCRNCWIGCGDGIKMGPPQREEKENYQCHNMKLLLKQQQRVLLSRSDVAGWGAFLKNTVGKHEYLGEYTGELISHREADKRGKIYDRENSSFLFNLNDQYVLDACRKGDKLKFANHSPNPNCYAKVIMVAGDHRVGIFAKERIMAGEELFYDYRYEADRAPAWARRGEDGNHGKKDDSGSSERRSKQAS